MVIKELNNKKIAIIGLGIENYALIKHLLNRKVACQLVIFETKIRQEIEQYRELAKHKNITWRLGQCYAKDLSEFDLIVHSPGSLVYKDKKVKIGQAIMTTPINLFFIFCPTKHIIGVTGTKGKGTTASLIAHILRTAKLKVWLGGNIGIALFAFIDKIKPTDWVVLELSSFQLEDIITSPHIAVFTNFVKEHLRPADPNNLNYHKTLAEYWRAKLNIAHWQTRSDYLIVNANLKKKLFKKKLASKIIYFTKSNLPSQLPGSHNQENIAAAIAVAKLAKIKQTDIVKAVASFQGLIYRLQLIRDLRGVKYYNDSFATTPEAAITALKSFTEPIILLAGGADKGSDFKSLAKIIKQRVKFVALLAGQATPQLRKALLNVGYPKNQMAVFTNLPAAIKATHEQAKIGEVVLLSTACASFGMFKNYKARGQLFTTAVQKLK
ncbi:MAG: UDP-N-acetylmuramoyl-L-alanine--D-glutamate ligase [bacterium]